MTQNVGVCRPLPPAQALEPATAEQLALLNFCGWQNFADGQRHSVQTHVPELQRLLLAHQVTHEQQFLDAINRLAGEVILPLGLGDRAKILPGFHAPVAHCYTISQVFQGRLKPAYPQRLADPVHVTPPGKPV